MTTGVDDAKSDGVPDTLDALTVPIEELRPYPGNPRRGAVPVIVESLRTNGQYRPLVVNRRTSEVLAGNHTLAAALELGWPRIAVTFVDVDDEAARRIVLIDNRSNDVATYDEDALGALLRSMSDLSGTGYTERDMHRLLGQQRAREGHEAEDDPFSKFTRDEIIDAAFEHFRAGSFPYKTVSRALGMQHVNRLAATPSALLRNSSVGYALADTYHPHRYEVKCAGRYTPMDGFEKDKLLRRAVTLMLDNGQPLDDNYLRTTLNFVSGVQAAANFRPGFALLMYRRFAEDGAVVLDTSTGFGGRLVGFLASRCAKYVGIDPNPLTHAGNTRLVDDMHAHERVELHNLPAEDVDPAVVEQRCSFAFTSPPYFAKEHYSDDDTQSWVRYKSGEAWRDGFLRRMLALQHAALQPGSTNVVNIADVEIGSETYPLVQWTCDCAESVGFEIVDIERYPVQRVMGQGDAPDDDEPVIVMRRP